MAAFLAERGLELSEQKTTTNPRQTGFNFLGQNVRKYRNKLVIKPAKEGLKALVQKTRECIKGCVGNGANADKQAQPDYPRLGQLSSLRLLGRSLLDRGTYHPRPTVSLGAANPPSASPTVG